MVACSLECGLSPLIRSIYSCNAYAFVYDNDTIRRYAIHHTVISVFTVFATIHSAQNGMMQYRFGPIPCG